MVGTDKSTYNKLEELQLYCKQRNIQSDLNISPMDVHTVFTSLRRLKQTATRGIDGLDGKILKLSAPIIAESLTYIYNLCIDKQCFPNIFKKAKIIPLYK